MKLLLHCCCAPCAIMPLQLLREEGHEVTAWFYNPNIHPYQEYKKRRDTLISYTGAMGIPLEVHDDYALEDFLRQVAQSPEERCPHCYRIRLEQAAKTAKAMNMDAFSTTLLISPYQRHDLLKETGEALAAEYDIPFYYQDFRSQFRAGQQKARELELYRQGYCGCIYSEKERYWREAK